MARVRQAMVRILALPEVILGCHLTSLALGFLTCKMGLVIMPRPQGSKKEHLSCLSGILSTELEKWQLLSQSPQHSLGLSLTIMLDVKIQ